MESILTSIKQLLGIEEKDDAFYNELIMHINTVFVVLKRMGVGPVSGFYIEDDSSTWNDFIGNRDDTVLEAVKTYIHLKVRLIFDTPTSSTVLNSINETIKELEWTLNFEVDDMNNVEGG